MNLNSYFLTLCLALSLIFTSCGTPGEEGYPDKPYDGEMTILVDQLYKDVMEAQVSMFMSNYPKTKINVIYDSEPNCIKGFMENKGKMLFLNRQLSPDEVEYAKEVKKFIPQTGDLAMDGLAFVCAKNAPVQNYKIEELTKILSVDDPSNKTIVFSNSNTGIVTYVLDSILKGQKLNTRSYAAGSPEATVDYVSQHPESIGLMSMYTILQSRGSVKSYLNKVNIIGVKTDSSEYYWQPYPLYIASRDYPFTLRIYFTLNEHYQGLATSFSRFLSKEKGQLLFYKFDLFPLKYNVFMREVEMTHDNPLE